MYDTTTTDPVYRMRMLIDALDKEVKALKSTKESIKTSCFGGVIAFFSGNIDDQIELKESKFCGLKMLEARMQNGGIKSKENFSEAIHAVKKIYPRFQEGVMSRVNAFVLAVEDYFSKDNPKKLSINSSTPSSSNYSFHNQF